jgi:hypothetical protein
MEDIAPVFAMIGMFTMIVYLVRMILDNRRKRDLAQKQFNLQNKLLEKFGSSQELVEYVKSDAGQTFLNVLPAEPPSNPYARILNSIQWGIALLTGGSACLFVRNVVTDGFEGFTVFGVFCLALGVGFLVSSAVAYILSKTWGVINGGSPKLPTEV